jgi:predicted O-methyltransferase YrrM
MTSTELAAFLNELEAFGLANDQRESDRSKKMLNLERETAQLMGILIRATRARNILEIGTSNGFGTIWMAAAAGPESRIITIDRNPQKVEMARDNLRRAGFLDRVDVHLGNATEIVSQLDGPFDLVLFDADRYSAPEQLRILIPKLTPSALVLADNALSHPEEIAGYLAAIGGMSEFEHTIVPVGKGLSIAVRK